MRIEYIELSSNEKLGIIEKADIKETILPQKNGSHSVFINKHFTSKPNQLVWEVARVDIGDNLACIYLVADGAQTQSFGSYARSRSKKRGTAFITLFSIIDVDFGHHSLVSDLKIDTRPNEIFADSLLPKELHKRRPCIVMGINSGRDLIQIIPLTTVKASMYEKSCLPISISSLSHLEARYKENTSYAMLGMIQSVSSYRAFPIRLSSGAPRYTDTSKIDVTDRQAIEAKLSELYSASSALATDNLKKRLRDKQIENNALIKKCNELELANVAMTEISTKSEILLRAIGDKIFECNEADLERLIGQLTTVTNGL